MQFVHRCAFCGWRHAAATAVMLSPACPDCGCALDSLARETFDSLPSDAPPAPSQPASTLTRLLIVAFGVILIACAARFGYLIGGVPIAIVGVGMAVYLLRAFIPKQGRTRPTPA